MTSFVDKIVAVHEALRSADVPHAFGGALALAYYVESPRATVDMDLNISLPTSDAERVLGALPTEVAWSDADVLSIRRDGQVRVLWDRTPVDLFFPQDRLHDVVAARIVHVPFAATTIPIVSAADLVIFKTLFNRPKDWVDIDEMLTYGEVDADEALTWVTRLLGTDDERAVRLATAVARR